MFEGNVLNSGSAARLRPLLPRSYTNSHDAAVINCPSSIMKNIGLSSSLMRVSTRANANNRRTTAACAVENLFLRDIVGKLPIQSSDGGDVVKIVKII